MHVEYLLVDGYNIINTWPELRETARDNLENARKALVDTLLDYQGYTGIKPIIVFDAHLTKGGQERIETIGPVDVVYTREHETADHYIERWTDRIAYPMQVRVATSDALQQTIVLSKGAVRISARELLELVRAAQKEMEKKYLKDLKPKSNTLESRTNPEILKILEGWRRKDG